MQWDTQPNIPIIKSSEGQEERKQRKEKRRAKKELTQQDYTTLIGLDYNSTSCREHEDTTTWRPLSGTREDMLPSLPYHFELVKCEKKCKLNILALATFAFVSTSACRMACAPSSAP